MSEPLLEVADLDCSYGSLQVLFGDPLVLGPALHLAHDQQGPSQLEGHRELLVVAEGVLQGLDRAVVL